MTTGEYRPPADPETLAYAIVRLAEAFLYNEVAIGIRGDRLFQRLPGEVGIGRFERRGPRLHGLRVGRAVGRRAVRNLARQGIGRR